MLYVGIDVYKIADKRVLWVLKIGEVGVWERNSQNDDRQEGINFQAKLHFFEQVSAFE